MREPRIVVRQGICDKANGDATHYWQLAEIPRALAAQAMREAGGTLVQQRTRPRAPLLCG